VTGVEELFFGLDVDEDFGDAMDTGEDAIFDDVGDGVAVADSDVAADNDVEVDVVAEADFANEAFFESNDSGDEDGHLSDVLLNFWGWRGVEDLGEG